MSTTEQLSSEITPSMDDFKQEMEQSFYNIIEGDIIKGVVIGITDTEVTIDLGYYTDGVIDIKELSNNPHFSIRSDIHIGDTISAMVILTDNEDGNISLSMKRATNILAWERLQDALEKKELFSVYISEAVNGGVISYVEGIRAFIPASHLGLSYIENLEDYVGKNVDAVIITADAEKSKLVLSVKEVEKDKAAAERNERISQLQRGLITKGTVEKLVPYGAFIRIDKELSGLVHISEICKRHIKSPKEVLKEGDIVKVKILDIKDGKISLSLKAVEDDAEAFEESTSAPIQYSSGETASTSLASLLSDFHF